MRARSAKNATTDVVVPFLAMSPASSPAYGGTAEKPGPVGALETAGDTSSVTLPATGMQVDARGLALGILAALGAVALCAGLAGR